MRQDQDTQGGSCISSTVGSSHLTCGRREEISAAVLWKEEGIDQFSSSFILFCVVYNVTSDIFKRIFVIYV